MFYIVVFIVMCDLGAEQERKGCSITMMRLHVKLTWVSYAGWFCTNLTQAIVTREEGVSSEECLHNIGLQASLQAFS